MTNTPKGETRPLPDPTKLFITSGVQVLQGKGFKERKDDYMFVPSLGKAVTEAFNKQPDTCFDGGNDKYFFTLIFRGTKMFVAINEAGGLTVMLPEEY